MAVYFIQPVKYRVSACDTSFFFQLWEQGFPAHQSNCLLYVLLLKWSRSCANKNHQAKAATL